GGRGLTPRGGRGATPVLRRPRAGGVPRVPGERERGGGRVAGRARPRPDVHPDLRRPVHRSEPPHGERGGSLWSAPDRARERALRESEDRQALLPLDDRLPQGPRRAPPRWDLVPTGRGAGAAARDVASGPTPPRCAWP